MARQDSFATGQWFGLPAKCRTIPFSNESRCREATGLTDAQLQCAVALVAAEFTLMGPVTAVEVGERVDCRPHHALQHLVRAGFAEEAGLARGREKLYRATPRAWKELGFVGWSLLRETA